MAARRLERLERESSQLEDEEREASLEEALADHTKVVKLTVDKWFVDKGFGFGKALSGEVVFIHASAVQGAEVLVVGTDAWTQVVSDHARAEGEYRARKAWGQRAWKEEKDRERASRAAQQVRRAATLTAELAARSESKVFEVCSQPPGLCDEPTAVALQPDSSLSVVVSDPLPAGQGFSSFSAKSREKQPGPDTRAQEKAALTEETQNFFVRATGKDEAQMQPEFKGMKLETLRKERDGWRKLAEEKQQLQDKKEEAWELFQRQPNWGSKRREDFEREYKQKVMTEPLYSPFASSKREEKFLQEWVDKLRERATLSPFPNAAR